MTNPVAENCFSTLVLTLPIQIRHISLPHFLSLSLSSSSDDQNDTQPMETFGEKDSSSAALRM